MRWARATVGLALALTLLASTARAADPAAAREQLKLGYNLAQDGKYEEALPHFVESLRLDPKGVTLLNLADCEEHVGRLADAMVHWSDARARAQAEGSKAIEEEATARAKALEGRLPRLTLILGPDVPTNATVERDGTVLGRPSLGIALPIDPGTHTIVVRAPGRAPSSVTVTMAEGATKSLELVAGPADSAKPADAPAKAAEPPARSEGGMSPLVYAGFGTAAAAAIAGTVTGVIALGAGSEAEKNCPNLECSPSQLEDIDSARTLGTVSTVMFVLAGVGAGVGVVGLVMSKRADKPVALRLSPMGALLQGRF